MPRPIPTREQEIERFWSKVNKSGNCWIWMGARRGIGYGQFCVFYKNTAAHRFSYEITHGEIPDGLLVLHKCDNPPCVNPDHLFLGTHQDNMDDRIRKGRGKLITKNKEPKPWRKIITNNS